jgi:hypothetical protein
MCSNWPPQHKEFHSLNEDEVVKAVPSLKKPPPEVKAEPEVPKPDEDEDDWNVQLVLRYLKWSKIHGFNVIITVFDHFPKKIL